MNEQMPKSYWAFRSAWSVFHLVLLAAIVAAVVMWWTTDGQGSAAFHAWWSWTQAVHDRLSNIVNFPWQ